MNKNVEFPVAGDFKASSGLNMSKSVKSKTGSDAKLVCAAGSGTPNRLVLRQQYGTDVPLF